MNIKEGNPLFKQKNLTIEQLVSNLRLLLQKQPRLATSATMKDLEIVLGHSSPVSECADQAPDEVLEMHDSVVEEMEAVEMDNNVQAGSDSNIKQDTGNLSHG